MIKLCRECKQKIQAEDWEKHRQSHRNKGKPSHWTAEGKRNRKRALERDRYRCRQCGRSKETLERLDLELHVHHVDPPSIELNALISLCSECHQRGGFLPRSGVW